MVAAPPRAIHGATKKPLGFLKSGIFPHGMRNAPGMLCN